ncbi:MAG: TonB-dependent receptor [Bacteroidaceae bacterium]|nr:TonB-dependent receptor [Bacteroidaceae bacterium]
MKKWCLLLLGLLPVTAWTQETTSLRGVQVTAQRRLTDTGLQKSSLDSTILHDHIASSLADILTRHSTLFIKSYGRATESTAEFRGTSPSHTQVTWNGMRINSPMLGTVDFSTIPSYFIDQATLYHGASSMHLTGGGLGGAVELKSLVPNISGNSLQYVQGIGSYSTYDQFLQFSHTGPKWRSNTRLVYSTSKNDFSYINHDKKVDVRDEQGNIVHSYHPKERNQSGYFTDIHALQDIFYNDGAGNRMGLSVWYAHHKRGLPFLSVDYKDDTDFTNEQGQNTLRSVLSWTHTESQWKSTVRGGYAYQDIAYDYHTTRQGIKNDITQSRSHTYNGYVQAEADYLPHEKWMLNAKAEAYYNKVRSHDKSPFQQHENYNKGRMEYHGSLQARWRPVSPFSVAAIIREEIYGKKWIPVMPALFADYVLYAPWKLVAKASVARNYRYPSMNDLYFKPGGNPDLEPEKGFTYDAGLEWDIRSKAFQLKGSFSAFDSYIKDWILWTPNTKGYWQPSNVKKVHNYGTEIMLEAVTKISKHTRASLTANYAFTPSINQGKPSNDNDASYGKQLCYVPKHSANISARLEWKTWALQYKWIHYSERFTTTSNESDYITGQLKPYFMSDMAIEKAFHWKRLDASVKVVVNNLLDTDYVTVLSRPMAGRNFEIFIQLRPLWKQKRQAF